MENVKNKNSDRIRSDDVDLMVRSRGELTNMVHYQFQEERNYKATPVKSECNCAKILIVDDNNFNIFTL